MELWCIYWYYTLLKNLYETSASIFKNYFFKVLDWKILYQLATELPEFYVPNFKYN